MSYSVIITWHFTELTDSPLLLHILNILARPCSDSGHLMTPHELSIIITALTFTTGAYTKPTKANI